MVPEGKRIIHQVSGSWNGREGRWRYLLHPRLRGGISSLEKKKKNKVQHGEEHAEKVPSRPSESRKPELLGGRTALLSLLDSRYSTQPHGQNGGPTLASTGLVESSHCGCYTHGGCWCRGCVVPSSYLGYYTHGGCWCCGLLHPWYLLVLWDKGGANSKYVSKSRNYGLDTSNRHLYLRTLVL